MRGVIESFQREQCRQVLEALVADTEQLRQRLVCQQEQIVVMTSGHCPTPGLHSVRHFPLP